MRVFSVRAHWLDFNDTEGEQIALQKLNDMLAEFPQVQNNDFYIRDTFRDVEGGLIFQGNGKAISFVGGIVDQASAGELLREIAEKIYSETKLSVDIWADDQNHQHFSGSYHRWQEHLKQQAN